MIEVDPIARDILTDQLDYIAESEKDVLESAQEYVETLGYLEELGRVRAERSSDIRNYDLPELPESEAFEVSEALREAERIASLDLTVDGYDDGSAEKPNQLLVCSGTANLLMTAEHATTHMRNGQPKEADFGVAGLGLLLFTALEGKLIVPTGKQTGDANADQIHPLKRKMNEVIYQDQTSNFISIHGLGRRALFHDLLDARSIDAVLGIGKNPSDATLEAVDIIRKVAEVYDLFVEPNISFVRTDGETGLVERKEDGSVATRTFAANGKGTTRTHAQKVMEDNGIHNGVAIQFELSPLLRFMPEGKFHGDKVAEAMGMYVGFKLIHDSLVHIGIK